MALDSFGLAHQTLFADLVDRAAMAEFDAAFPPNGSFAVVTGSNGQRFWYYRGYRPDAPSPDAARYQKYVGPVADASITRRVEQFREAKLGWREQRRLVASLVAAGFPAPPALVGRVVAALGQGGLFRLHGVLVGTLAFQCYAGLLGFRLRGAMLMTSDIDIAQFHAVSVAVDDTMLPVLDQLQAVDPTFRAIPGLRDPGHSTAYTSAGGLKVEFLTPNRGSDDLADVPSPKPSLGGAFATPLRFLDFLLRDPVRAVLLHGAGVSVLVPAPERYAVHKLILSELRRDDPDGAAKAGKDLAQAALLAEALVQVGRVIDLGAALLEAETRGERWRQRLTRALTRVPPSIAAMLADARAEALALDAGT